MIRVAQSTNDTERVDIHAIKDLGIELMTYLRSGFLNESEDPWIMIIPSVHQMCAHGLELFQLNDGLYIAKWSENPIESCNKHVRSFQSGTAARARQLSVKENIHNIFRRMLIMSHPFVAKKRPRPICSICGEIGHTARSLRHKILNVPTAEEDRFNSLYV